jgi:hypothetical protein
VVWWAVPVAGMMSSRSAISDRSTTSEPGHTGELRRSSGSAHLRNRFRNLRIG